MEASLLLSYTPEEVAHGLRFPHRDPYVQIFWTLVGALAFAVFAWILSRIEKRRRPRPLFMPDPAESRRSQRRVKVRLPADVQVGGHPLPDEAILCDLSPGGATVLSDRPIMEGTRIHLRFSPDDGEEEDFSAEVLHSDPSRWSKRNFLHCQFLGLTGPQEQRLLHAVAGLERREIRDGAEG